MDKNGNGGRLGARILGATLAACLGASVMSIAGSASAQTLSGDYLFQDTLSDGSGTPDLQTLGSGTAFATETVDGVSRRVFTWPSGSGLSLNPFSQLAPPSTYTIVMLMRMHTTTGYRRVLDFKGAGDEGLYIASDRLTFEGHGFGPVSITPDKWHQIVLTRNGSEVIKGYVDGVEQFSFNDATTDYAVVANDTLRFFVDADNGTEESSGAIARLRIYDGAMTSSQVASLDRLPGQGGSTPSATPSRSASPSPSASASSSPSASASASPTPSSSASPSPQPSQTPPPSSRIRYVNKGDRNDVRGPLDIRKVSMGAGSTFYSLKLSFHQAIRARHFALGGGGVAYVYLDTAPEEGRRTAEYRVRVYRAFGGWESRLERFNAGGTQTISVEPAKKIDPLTLRFTFDADGIVVSQDSIYFQGRTGYKKKGTRCAPTCRDRAPDSGYVRFADVIGE